VGDVSLVGGAVKLIGDAKEADLGVHILFGFLDLFEGAEQGLFRFG
jgi:hypothetical protein